MRTIYLVLRAGYIDWQADCDVITHKAFKTVYASLPHDVTRVFIFADKQLSAHGRCGDCL